MNYSKPFYSALLIYLPLSIIILWTPMPGILYRVFSYDPQAVFNEFLWCLTGFLSILIASAYVTILKKDFYRSMIANVRGCFFIMILAWLFSSLMPQLLPWLVKEDIIEDLTFAERLTPSLNSVIAVVVAAYGWFSVIFYKRTFRGLELFSHFSSTYKEEQLHHQMREFAPEMGQARDELKAIPKNYGMSVIPACLILNISGYTSDSMFLIILVFLIFSMGIFLIGLFSLQRRELSFATEGVALSIRDKVLPIPVMLCGIVIASIFAFVGSSNNSLLPPGIALQALESILGFFSALFSPIDPSQMPFSQGGGMGGGGMGMGDDIPIVGEEYPPWEGFTYVRYFVIGAIIALFLIFMVYPIIKRSKLSFKDFNLLVMIKRWISDIKKDILAFFSAFGEKDKSQKLQQQEKIESIAREILPKGYRNKELARSVNLFAQLILWGIETLSIPWRPSLAPGEYCGLMAAAVESQDTSMEIIRSSFLFEKSLYSPRRLSETEESEYKALVEKIILIT